MLSLTPSAILLRVCGSSHIPCLSSISQRCVEGCPCNPPLFSSTMPYPKDAKSLLRPSNQHSKLLQLPAELVLNLCRHLHVVHSIALALSCTSLYNIIFPYAIRALEIGLEAVRREGREHIHKSPTDTSEGPGRRIVDYFMPSLERHLPSCYYCGFCLKLHPYAKITPPFLRPRKGSPQCWKRTLDVSPKGSKLTGRTPLMGHHHGRLAILRHVYGEPFGIPLSFLNTEQKLSYSSKPAFHYLAGDPSWNHKRTFKIHRNELILETELQLKASNLEALQFVLAHENWQLCCHVTTGQHIPQKRGRLSTQRARVPGLSGIQDAQANTMNRGHCEYCMSDYVTQFKRSDWRTDHVDREPSYTVTISGYHLLGNFEHPIDNHWRRFSRLRNPVKYHEGAPWNSRAPIEREIQWRRDMALFPEGSVWVRWHVADQRS